MLSEAICKSSFEQIWSGLTWEKKAGYLVWPSVAGATLTAEEIRLLKIYAPRGVSLFARNLQSLAQGQDLVRHMRQLISGEEAPGQIEPVFAIDEEGGRVCRLPHPFPRLPAMQNFANKSNAELRSQVLLQAGTARALGIRMIFAPVVDLLTESKNRVIGDRSFGADPKLVVEKSLVVYEALLSCGIMPVLKHFPGHGFSIEDTHVSLARTNLSESQLMERELSVFRSLISRCSPAPAAIMTCHVIFDALEKNVPATFSQKILQDLLRKQLGHTGVIMSDDLRMNAIAQWLGENRSQQSAIDRELQEKIQDDGYLAEATLRAVRAGCDVVLACRSIEREEICLRAVADEMARSAVFAEQCRESAFRIVSCFGTLR